jgi:hypothetical protein
MGFEENIITSFKKAKEDAEGIKNELAFALRRIAKIEEVLNRQALEKISNGFKNKKSAKKSKKKKH